VRIPRELLRAAARSTSALNPSFLTAAPSRPQRNVTIDLEMIR